MATALAEPGARAGRGAAVQARFGGSDGGRDGAVRGAGSRRVSSTPHRDAARGGLPSRPVGRDGNLPVRGDVLSGVSADVYRPVVRRPQKECRVNEHDNEEPVVEETLVEEVSIDGMCGVY